MARLESHLTLDDKRRAPFHDNKRAWQRAREQLMAERQRLAQGGGEKAKKRLHDKGRLSARERVSLLLDPDTPFDELMMFAADGLYPEVGETPCAGVITGIGRVAGRDWLIIANDATVKAGAFFPATAKKVIRAQTIALENHLPTIYLVDSAGVYLPMQDEIFPDQDDFGRVFYLNARMSAAGIPQIAAIMGNCVAGGAYLPVMCDTLIMTEGSGLYLAGPALVKAAIGQETDSDALGGAAVHAELSGTADYHEPDDAAALARIRRLAARYPVAPRAAWAKVRQESHPPQLKADDLHGLVPLEGGSQGYDMRELIGRLVDGSRFDEYKAAYGQTLICGAAHLGGYPVGIVANQKKVLKVRGRLQVGGVIYADAADKAARFVLNCNQMGIPLIFLHDVSGFMVGKESEHEGIIRRGAKLVNAVSNSVVPRLSVIIGGSYGAGHYAMSGKAYAPRFIFAWPSAKYSVMGAQQAAKTILDIQLAQQKRRGGAPDEAALKALYQQIQGDYQRALDIRYAAARLWVDELILPLETRGRLIRALDVCAHQVVQEPLRIGVFQV